MKWKEARDFLESQADESRGKSSQRLSLVALPIASTEKSANRRRTYPS